MSTELKDQIRALMEHGVGSVTAQQAVGRARPATRRALATPPQLTPRRAVAAAAGVAAVACASVLAASQLGGPAGRLPARGHKAPTVLTAAMVRHVASASRLAMAHSGRAVISYTDEVGGKPQDSGTEDITFSGRNWNLILHFPPGQEGAERYVINRVVNGRAYDYFTASHGLTWYHVTGPTAVSSLHIPDPRLLLRELEPTARFAVTGHGVISGTPVTELQATEPRVLRLGNLPDVVPGGQLTALTVWVDNHGVVRRMSMTARQRQTVFSLKPRHPGGHVKIIRMHRDWHGKPAIEQQIKTIRGRKERIIRIWAAGGLRAQTQTQVSTMTVTFTDIGKPQVITAPRHAITVYGRG